MIYFALNPDGLLYNLGDHGDWESAEETASNMRIDPIWTLNENEALNWAEFILTEIKQTREAIKKVTA
jgi:hypothetical protein